VSTETTTTSDTTTTTQECITPLTQYEGTSIYYIKLASIGPTSPNVLSRITTLLAYDPNTDAGEGMWLVEAYYDLVAQKYLFALARPVNSPGYYEALFPAVGNNIRVDVYLAVKSTEQYCGNPQASMCVQTLTSATPVSVGRPTAETTVSPAEHIAFVIAPGGVSAKINDKSLDPITVEAPQDTDLQSFLNGMFADAKTSAQILQACGQAEVTVGSQTPAVVVQI